MPSVIALDAMGSDRAPKPEIEGALHAARQFGVRVLLVGPQAIVKAELDRHRGASHLPVEIVHASEYITMEDKVEAIRAKRDNSMRVGLRLVREGRANGFVTAGNTGAAMATAKIVLGGVPGVDRPALAAVFPTAPGTAAMLLDVGANVDCTPQNLEQFAVMGDVYFRAMFGRKVAPRVGLLSIGEEETKGNELTREAFQLLKQLPLNFVGNVEGRDLYNGEVDVIVADGFVGNVALKISEGVANLVRTALKESLKATITRQVGALLSRSAFTDFKKRLDHTEYGGAPLLGVKGVCIITHGSSNSNAMKNAVRVAAEFSQRGINESIERGLAALKPTHAESAVAQPT
jgi:phosphate acyltransferase